MLDQITLTLAIPLGVLPSRITLCQGLREASQSLLAMADEIEREQADKSSGAIALHPQEAREQRDS